MGWSDQNVIARLVIIEGDDDGLFVYDGTPAAGTLIYAVSATAGEDQFGNVYQQGAGTISSAFDRSAVLNGGGIEWFYDNANGHLAAQELVQPEGDFDILARQLDRPWQICSGSDNQDGCWIIPPSGDTTGATDTAWLSGCLSLGNSAVYLPGQYYWDATLAMTTAGQTVTGAGQQATKVQMVTSGTPIVQLAADYLTFGGMQLAYKTAQGSADTSGFGIMFGDPVAGSCFMSTIYDINVVDSYTGLTVNPALSSGSVAGLFSCYLRNIHVSYWYESAIDLEGNAGGPNNHNTGVVFDNTYLQNNPAGTNQSSNSWPVHLQNWDEIVFNQLNIEHTDVPNTDVLAVAEVGNITINALHMEGLTINVGNDGSGLISDNAGPGGSMVINSWTVKFLTVNATVSNPVTRIASGTGPWTFQVSGFEEGTTNTLPGGAAHPWIDFGSVPDGSLIVYGDSADQTTALAVNAATGCTAQVYQPASSGLQAGAPGIPGSGDPLASPYTQTMTVYITAGTAGTCTVGINSATVAVIAATLSVPVRLRPLDTITLTYTHTPNWAWAGD
jgi:hypothetical protein